MNLSSVNITRLKGVLNWAENRSDAIPPEAEGQRMILSFVLEELAELARPGEIEGRFVLNKLEYDQIKHDPKWVESVIDEKLAQMRHVIITLLNDLRSPLPKVKWEPRGESLVA